MVRVLRTAGLTLRKTFYLDGDPVDGDGPVTVSIARLDGEVIQTGAAEGPVDHEYSFDFAGRDVLDILRVSWQVTIDGDTITLDQDEIEVVGGFYFTLDRARRTSSAFTNLVKYPDDTMLTKRDETEAECERITGQAWVPRFRRVTVDARGGSVLFVPDQAVRAVRSVSVAQVYGDTPSALSVDQVARVAPGPGYLIWANNEWPCGPQTVTVEYEYGADSPPPNIVNASLTRFKSLVLSDQSSIPDRARQITNQETGTILLAMADADHTGIPSVDATYLSYQLGAFG